MEVLRDTLYWTKNYWTGYLNAPTQKRTIMKIHVNMELHIYLQKLGIWAEVL